MYIRILHLIAKKKKKTSEQFLARRLFLWLTFGKRLIKANELQDILTPLKEEISSHPKVICRRDRTDEFADFENNIIMVSGSLVESRWSGDLKATIYCFIHSSVMKFFKSKCEDSDAICSGKAGSLEYFLPPNWEAESELMISCLSYIFQRVPGRPLSGNMLRLCRVQASTTFFLSSNTPHLSGQII
jgi:hypothetical protein